MCVYMYVCMYKHWSATFLTKFRKPSEPPICTSLLHVVPHSSFNVQC